MAQQNMRKTAKTEFWRTHIARQKKSGKTEKSYCNRYALSYATFRFWKKKLKDEEGHFVQLAPEKFSRIPLSPEDIARTIDVNTILSKLTYAPTH